MSEQFLYHFVPKNMEGSVLFPLNRLSDIHPGAHANEIKKYQGRERLLEKRVPILDCKWNDVIHISPINPQIILDTWKKNEMLEYAIGVGYVNRCYKIPAEKLNWNRTVCYQSYNYDFANFDPQKEKFEKISAGEFLEQKTVDSKQVEIWKSDKEAKRKLFWYSHTRHILTLDEIDISGCDIISIS